MLFIQTSLAIAGAIGFAMASSVSADTASSQPETQMLYTDQQMEAFADVREQFSGSAKAAQYALRFGQPDEAVFERSKTIAEITEFLSKQENTVLKISEYGSKPVFYVSESAFRTLGYSGGLLPNADKIDYLAKDRGDHRFNLNWIVIEELSDVAQEYRRSSGIFPKNDVLIAVEHVGAFRKGHLLCTTVFTDELFSEDRLDEDPATREFIRVWNEEVQKENSVIATTCSDYGISARGGGREPARVGRTERKLSVNGIRLPEEYFESDILNIETVTLEAFSVELREMIGPRGERGVLNSAQ